MPVGKWPKGNDQSKGTAGARKMTEFELLEIILRPEFFWRYAFYPFEIFPEERLGGEAQRFTDLKNGLLGGEELCLCVQDDAYLFATESSFS